MKNENKPLIRLVGAGMDGNLTLTQAGRAAIDDSDALFGAKRLTELFAALGKPVFHTWKAAEIGEIVKRNGFARPCVLLSGDCGFYSAAGGLVNGLDGTENEFKTEIICGISTPVYFSSKIKIPWQDMKFVSLHGTDNSIVRNVCRNKYCFFLLGGDISAAEVCGELCDYGLSDIGVYIGENLGGADERISVGTARKLIGGEYARLSVLVTDNPDYERGARFGIPDGDFLRGDVPMTKSEIRAVVMSKLAVRDWDICWDIGCGTGSVTVEMALNCGSGRVYAADVSENAAELSAQNCKKFHCDNAFVYRGEAPEVFNDLPAPDCVFIGGSGGKLSEIVNAAYSKANSGARIVVTAITLNTLETARRSLEALGTEPEIVQIAVTRVGAGSMLSALNPIFIIKGVKP